MNQQQPDPRLDEQLRDVPVPDGLLTRLRNCIVATDEQLDQQLRDVPIPDHLLANLRQAVADAAVDQWLFDVPVPSSVVSRLRVIADRRPRSRVRWLTAAAALFLVLTTGYWSIVLSLLGSIAPRPPRTLDLPISYRGPLEIESPLASVQLETIGELPQWPPAAADQGHLNVVPEIQFADWHGPINRSGGARSLMRALDQGLRLEENLLLLRWGIIGYPHRVDDRLPELDTASSPVPRGMPAPLSPGYDRRFLLQHAAHPIVYLPGPDPSLHRISAPLTTRTDSYDSAWRSAELDQLPDTVEVHVEDFLAAMEYALAAPPAGRLTMYRAAGTSPFGPDGSSLLQVAVKAGASPARGLAATHLTIALDVSASMRWENRLANCRRAIRQLIDQLGPHDRLSLIAFNEQVVSVVENATRDDPQTLIEEVDELRGDGGTNLSAGLQQAMIHSLSAPFGRDVSRRVVLITDSRESNPPHVVQRLRACVREAATQGLAVHVLDLAMDSGDDDRLLATLAHDGQGRIVPVRTPQDLRWALVEALTDESSVVASDAVLTVTFNPRAVRWYRLIGHEATQLGGLMPAAIQAVLRAGQESSVLLELMLIPGNEDKVATVELVWTDPQTGQIKRMTQRVSRLQFAPSFSEAALPLQAAAIAAETAEVLRRSPFVKDPRARDLSAVRMLVDQVNPRLARRPAFQRFVELIDRLQQVVPRSSSPR